MRRSLYVLLIIALALVLVVGVIGTVNVVQASESYVCIDINPSVEFVINRNNMVTKVNALDADAEIVLNGLELVDKTLDEATEIYLAAATELGYIDTDATEADPNAVLVTVTNFSNIKQERIRTGLMTTIDDYMLNNGIWGISFSSEAMAEIQAEADAAGISTGKMRMIKAIQISYPEKTTDELKVLSIKQLIALARDVNPVDTLVANYEARLAEFTAVAEIDRTLEQSEEILEITEKLSDIEALQLKLAADREERRLAMEAKHEAYLEAKETRKQQRLANRQNFIDNMIERAQEIMQEHFQYDLD